MQHLTLTNHLAFEKGRARGGYFAATTGISQHIKPWWTPELLTCTSGFNQGCGAGAKVILYSWSRSRSRSQKLLDGEAGAGVEPEI